MQRETGGDAQTLLTELISGPNPAEPRVRLLIGGAGDAGVALGRRRRRGRPGDVNDALLDLTSGDLIDAVAQIVFTASEIPGAQSVLIRVDGATRVARRFGCTAQRPAHHLRLHRLRRVGAAGVPGISTPTTAVPSSTTTTLPATTTSPATTTTAADSGADGGADHHDDALDRDDGRGCGGRGFLPEPPPGMVRRRPQAGAASSSYEKKISATPW